MSELDGRLDPTQCRQMIFPSGSGWVLMYVPQREHKKDFLLGLPIFPQGAKRKLTPVRHLLLAARIHSTVWPKPSLSPPTKIVVSVEEYQPPDHPEFRRPDEVPLQRYQGATALLIGHLRRRSRPPAFCLRTNSRASSDTSGVQSGVGHNQPRLPAFHIFK